MLYRAQPELVASRAQKSTEKMQIKQFNLAKSSDLYVVIKLKNALNGH